MQSPFYYREQAKRARRWARDINNRDIQDSLERMAWDFDQIAEDLERGLIYIRHPRLLPQRQ
jgi:hypothetical protein